MISGTGFGQKPSTGYFEDFEDKTTGETIGELHLSNPLGSAVVTTRALSGKRSLEQDFSKVDFPKIYRKLSGERPRHYFSCWLYITGSIPGSTVWKMGRIGAGDVYGGVPRAGVSYTSDGASLPQSFAGEIVTSAGISSYWAQNTASAVAEETYKQDQWLFYEFEFDAGSMDKSDAFLRERIDGIETVAWTSQPFLTSEAGSLPSWFLTPINGLDQGPAVRFYMDSIYTDESRARVVATDKADYKLSTRWNVQPILSYSDAQVVVRQHTPSFAPGEAIYLHLFDEVGSLVSTVPATAGP